MNLLLSLLHMLVVCYSYRIRLPTEKEQEMVVSKAVKKLRYFETTLLLSYKVCSVFCHCSCFVCLVLI